MAVDFSKLVFFGDSLTDKGNLPQPARPDPPYVGGRFSNGPVYSEVLARELGVASDNFALGGAEAATDAGDSIVQRSINLTAQVNAYLNLQTFFNVNLFSSRVAPGTAASIAIGSNDIINERPDTSTEATNLAHRIVTGIANEAVNLASNGTGHIVLYTLPKVSETPRSQLLSAVERAAEDATVAAANKGIKTFASQAAALIETTVIDITRMQAEVRDDRETFGLQVLDTPIYNKIGNTLIPTGITSQVSANQVEFFDPIHPTKAVHAIFAAFSEATLKADRVVFRGGAADNIKGSSQADLILSGLGNDKVTGGDSHDVIFAGAGADRVDAGLGNDLAAGGGGDDALFGSAGIDFLAGNEGFDQLFGGSGSDLIVGGGGGDQAFGETGNDVFYFTDDGLGNGLDQITGGSGIDTLRLNVSANLSASSEFKSELDDFKAALAGSPGAALTFGDLDLVVSGIERLEVRVAGKVVFAAGHAAVAQSPTFASLLHDADLWGLV